MVKAKSRLQTTAFSDRVSLDVTSKYVGSESYSSKLIRSFVGSNPTTPNKNDQDF